MTSHIDLYDIITTGIGRGIKRKNNLTEDSKMKTSWKLELENVLKSQAGNTTKKNNALKLKFSNSKKSVKEKYSSDTISTWLEFFLYNTLRFYVLIQTK
jgi:hypothetical protein